jgi:hypothetical protein
VHLVHEVVLLLHLERLERVRVCAGEGGGVLHMHLTEPLYREPLESRQQGGGVLRAPECPPSNGSFPALSNSSL